MKRLQVGDKVKAFLDANICGIIEHLELVVATTELMVGGVPPGVLYAHIRLANNQMIKVKTTELFFDG